MSKLLVVRMKSYLILQPGNLPRVVALCHFENMVTPYEYRQFCIIGCVDSDRMTALEVY
jgi:hypothetical protein